MDGDSKEADAMGPVLPRDIDSLMCMCPLDGPWKSLEEGDTFWSCKTCGVLGSDGAILCQACAIACHAGHDLVPSDAPFPAAATVKW